ncbi:hypothetical protein KABACHOK_05080 [Brevundimonas phage vB_BpoS-Kabachok]|uniref:Uncharacterized protein n=1 Tax=Brevundimonas phage vB_BpoS-Kabachok TaxID=2948600 RepID=A0A9E7SK34_9CAUD|nr:hypothetical protein KABACHOK_05080 [Brevundimonas phage vB_BpoS-Kabachok]
MNSTSDDYFGWLDEGGNRLFAWCISHWRATLVVVGGTPVMTGVVIGYILGKCF